MTYEEPTEVVLVAVLVPILANLSTASARCFGARWEYLRTIAKDLCPSSSAKATGPTPVIVHREANVCRESWKRKLGIFRSRDRRFKPDTIGTAWEYVPRIELGLCQHV